MAHSRRPPWRLGLAGVQLLSSASHDLPPVVRINQLLAWLHEFDVGFCQDSAVRLLEILKYPLIVPPQKVIVSNADQGFLITCHVKFFTAGPPEML